MDVRTEQVDSVTVIRLTGDLDSASAPAAQEQILGDLPENARILLDLSEVPFVSSAGLRTMLLCYRQAQCVGSVIALVGLSPNLRTVLGATGFLRFFICADSVADGVAALRVGTGKRGEPA